jgi:hypothetical protein
MTKRIVKEVLLRASALAMLGVFPLAAWGQAADKIEVKRGKVAYVSGNDLVLKMSDGSVKHVVVPSDFKFNIDGKELGVTELKPGMELTQTIASTTKDTVVTGVRQVDAKVLQVNAPYVTLTLPDGKSKRVKVPDGTKFDIAGQQKTVFDLRPGMQLTGTIVTKTPETVVSSTRSRVTGTSPPAVETPELEGVLLIVIEEVDLK